MRDNPGKKLPRSIAIMAVQRREARKALVELAKERQMAVRDIVGRYNYPEIVAVRTEFMRRASAMGLGCIMIGRILDRNYTTVLYHLNDWKPRKRAWRLAKAAAEREA